MYRFEEKDWLEYSLIALCVILAFLIGVRIAYPPYSLTDSAFSFLLIFLQPVQQLSQFFQSLGMMKEAADILAIPGFWILIFIMIYAGSRKTKRKVKKTEGEGYFRVI